MSRTGRSKPAPGRRGVEQGADSVFARARWATTSNRHLRSSYCSAGFMAPQNKNECNRSSAKINGISTINMSVPSQYEMPRSALSAAANLNQHRSTHECVGHKQAPSPGFLYAHNVAQPPYMASASGKVDLGHDFMLGPRRCPLRQRGAVIK